MKTIAVGTSVRVVSAEGEIDLQTAPQLDELLRSLEAEHVILDLTEATFVDSSTLSLVVATDARIREGGGHLSIAAGNPTVSRLLESTGLDQALEVHRTLADAIESVLEHAVVAVEAHRQKDSAR